MEKRKPGPTVSQLYRRVILTMADVDQGKRPWAAVSIIASFVALTLLHDACALKYMQTAEGLIGANHHVILPLVLALAEVTACIATFKFGCPYGPYFESIGLVIISHLFGAFVKNIWIQSKEPEFGIFGAFMEPLMGLMLLYLCKGSCTNSIRLICITLMTFGLTLCSVNVSTFLKTNRTVVITMVCGVFFNLRNICVLHWHEENVTILLRSAKTLTIFASSTFMVSVAAMAYLANGWVISLPLALVTCCLHVCVTYIACALLLAKFSVPTLCILSAFGQFLEGLVLVASSHRPTLVMAAVACVIVLSAVYLYTYDVVETGHAFHTVKIVSTNEMFTRIQFLIFFASVLGVLFYVLQPRVSQRDLQSLSLVGLDKVVRRLLSLDLPEGHEQLSS